MSRKYEILKKGEATQEANISKQILKVQKVHQRLANIRTDYINKTVAKIVKGQSLFITIEDLNISGMMKNRHISKVIASQKFYEFRTKLLVKRDEHKIEMRIVNKFPLLLKYAIVVVL